MKNLAQHVIEWLDSIGADGLMHDTKGGTTFYEKDELEIALETYYARQLVPAYRHADGSYHAEPEEPILVLDCKVLRAEVEELKELIEEVVPVGDIADGLAPYYIESDTIHRMRKALEGKE